MRRASRALLPLGAALVGALFALPREVVADEPSRFERAATLGVKWSPAVSIPDNGGDFFFAFAGGAASILRFTDSLALQPEVLYAIRGWRPRDPTPMVEERVRALHYVDLPVHGRVEIPLSERTRVAVLAGAQVSVLLFGIERDDFVDERIVTSSIPASTMRRVLPSASGGIAAEFDLSRLVLTLEARVVRSLQSVGRDASSPALTSVGAVLGVMY